MRDRAAGLTSTEIATSLTDDGISTARGARTWQPLHSNLNFGRSCEDCVMKINFIDPITGWTITLDGSGSFNLWKTADGGITWIKLSPMLIP